MITEARAIGTPAGSSGAVTTFLNQLWKNLETQPGWVPLLIGYYLLLSRVSETATLFGISIWTNIEIIVALLTFVSYQIGDAIDKPIFRDFEGSRLDRKLGFVIDSRDKAKHAFGVDHGVYRVSKDILSAAGSYNGSRAHLTNESAKFLRSVAIPVVFLALPPIAAPAVVHWSRLLVAVLAFAAYLVLKPLHMRLLYIGAVAQKRDNESKYSTCDLPNGSRLYFWDGEFVTSASRAKRSEPAT